MREEVGVLAPLRTRANAEPGGYRELLRLALPLIITNSCWTLQLTIDRVFLGHYSTDAVAAVMPSMLEFWSPFALLQFTAAYGSTFVAQYLGAGRPRRVGPVVWQSLHFSIFGGLAFLLLLPAARPLAVLTGHPPVIAGLEATYFSCLCFAALPMLVTAATCGFFIGRGDNWTVLLINGTGLAVNAVLGYAWIFGAWGFPEGGMAGAGWATVAGSTASSILGLILFLRPRFRKEFGVLDGWRLDLPLLRRLLRFGLPSGLQVACDIFAFTMFTVFVGQMGKAELTASSVAITLNMLGVLPALGISQAVAVLVGRRLGENRPDVAERSTWTAFKVTWLYMAVVAALYILLPDFMASFFHGTDDAAAGDWPLVAGLVPVILRFVAVYTLFDGMNFVFSSALKGAGDTRFVTAALLLLSWPVMVLPTWLAQRNGWGLFWAWGFASAYVISLALTFLARFRRGRWKSMRVIEPAAAT
jgi:MATE family multidrug resistance protein